MVYQKDIYTAVSTKRILFVGNSLTYANDLPGRVAQLGKENDAVIKTKMIAHPEYTLKDHWDAGQFEMAVSGMRYDFVLAQQGPSFGEEERIILVEYGAKMKAVCEEYKVRLAFFMVWPDLMNIGKFDEVIRNYTDAATATDSLLCPVGQVWKEYFLATKDYSYYSSDKFHPSKKGTEAAARVIFESINNIAI